MKQILAYFATLFLLCNLSAQQPKPVQIETIGDSAFVVQYVPVSTAQKNVTAQLTQTDKQIEVTEKQIAELVKKRDELLRQKAGLEYASVQLAQAANAPKKAAPAKQQSTTTTPPPQADKPKKKKSGKKKPGSSN